MEFLSKKTFRLLPNLITDKCSLNLVGPAVRMTKINNLKLTSKYDSVGICFVGKNYYHYTNIFGLSSFGVELKYCFDVKDDTKIISYIAFDRYKNSQGDYL